jgi:hypothetical protein
LTAASTAGRSPAFRAISAAELLFGAFFVIGHNVFRAVPNEVLILAALGVASARLRNGGLAALGFRRPESWRRIVLIALAAAALRILLGDLVIDPATAQFWPASSSCRCCSATGTTTRDRPALWIPRSRG